MHFCPLQNKIGLDLRAVAAVQYVLDSLIFLCCVLTTILSDENMFKDTEFKAASWCFKNPTYIMNTDSCCKMLIK